MPIWLIGVIFAERQLANILPEIMHWLDPRPVFSTLSIKAGIFVALAFSALCVFIAPLFMPQNYSWVANYISESAAQGQQHAWVTRLGFLLFGLAVWGLSNAQQSSWPRAANWLFIGFAICMFGTAAFSHKPWQPNGEFDVVEDILHSITATGMGFAFSFGVLFCLISRPEKNVTSKAFDVCALLAAILLPSLGNIIDGIGGLTQRIMFIVAYLWYAKQTLAIK